jgi:hypothetical protein
MKKSILNIAILLSIFSVALISCSKDEDDIPELSSGKYDILMDGQTIASGSSIEVGFLANLASISEGDDFGILVASVPLTTGATYQFDSSNSSGTVTIMGKNLLMTDSSNEMYFSISGSVKRESTTKISFQGVCSDMGSTATHTFSGTIESDAYKLIN